MQYPMLFKTISHYDFRWNRAWHTIVSCLPNTHKGCDFRLPARVSPPPPPPGDWKPIQSLSSQTRISTTVHTYLLVSSKCFPVETFPLPLTHLNKRGHRCKAEENAGSGYVKTSHQLKVWLPVPFSVWEWKNNTWAQECGFMSHFFCVTLMVF